ncbi:histidine phosphatase family protein [Candidatus Pantoea multigeneris]|uniref:Histidine phosphatase family protein n=1 Tax=Candidatus Pantoea multigeneris TaxID=2608357 RepID=A0ABX0RAZ1_9GAMM|nr:histidine phosphatase family protein [Pantoea multigeneris]NIF22537.1 histidine phosphatase family protein [Pantoea multigeneris]
MTIILMRHGKPDHPNTGVLDAAGVAAWCAAYDLAGVCDHPPLRSQTIAANAGIIVSSSLPRARASLERLGLQPCEVNDLFCEVGIPQVKSKRLQLPTTLWLAVLRLLWLCGYQDGQAESLQHARQRAVLAAERLITLSQQGTVLLVGHGIMNKMIARQLRKRGWQAEKHASSRHWSTAIYHRPFI